MSKVSIIMPAYNSEKQIERAINSVLNQTHKNLELIIINDGSKDNTDKICERYSKLDKRIVYIKKENEGVSKTRNLGISKATGKYMMFIDSDDEYNLSRIEKMCEAIEEGEFEVVVSGFEIFENNKNSIITTTIDYNKKTTIEIIEILCKNRMFFSSCNKMYLTKIIKDNNLYMEEKIEKGEDLRFNVSYFSNIKKIRTIPDVLYTYYREDTGLGSKYHENEFKLRMENISYVESLYNKWKYNKNYINYLRIRAFYAQIYHDLKYYKNNKDLSKRVKVYLEDNEMTEAMEKYKPNTLMQKILHATLKTKNSMKCIRLSKILSFIKNKFTKNKHFFS